MPTSAEAIEQIKALSPSPVPCVVLGVKWAAFQEEDYYAWYKSCVDQCIEHASLVLDHSPDVYELELLPGLGNYMLGRFGQVHLIRIGNERTAKSLHLAQVLGLDQWVLFDPFPPKDELLTGVRYSHRVRRRINDDADPGKNPRKKPRCEEVMISRHRDFTRRLHVGSGLLPKFSAVIPGTNDRMEWYFEVVVFNLQAAIIEVINRQTSIKSAGPETVDGDGSQAGTSNKPPSSSGGKSPGRPMSFDFSEASKHRESPVPSVASSQGQPSSPVDYPATGSAAVFFSPTIQINLLNAVQVNNDTAIEVTNSIHQPVAAPTTTEPTSGNTPASSESQTVPVRDDVPTEKDNGGVVGRQQGAGTVETLSGQTHLGSHGDDARPGSVATTKTTGEGGQVEHTGDKISTHPLPEQSPPGETEASGSGDNTGEEKNEDSGNQRRQLPIIGDQDEDRRDYVFFSEIRKKLLPPDFIITDKQLRKFLELTPTIRLRRPSVGESGIGNQKRLLVHGYDFEKAKDALIKYMGAKREKK